MLFGEPLYNGNLILHSRPSGLRASRWAAHFLSEGDAAQAQTKRIQQAKDAKQTIR
jgi:hypothetical protein